MLRVSMTNSRLPFSISAAVAIGLAQTLLLVLSWQFIAAHSFFPTWLALQGVTGLIWRAAILLYDTLINISLSLPAAYLLTQLRPRRIIFYLVSAVVPGFIWQYNSLIFERAALSNLATLIPGILSALFTLPLATFLIFAFRRRENA